MLKRFGLTLTVVALSALAVAGAAMAQTVPTIPVDEYGQSLLSSLANAVGDVLPWVAAVTAFAIGVGLIFRHLGKKRATSV